MRLSLVIPAFNEAKRLPPFLQAIADYNRTHPADIFEIIVVDDGSTDNTAAIAESFKTNLPKLKIIRQTQNRGKGAAVRAGVLAAQGDAIAFMDADGATPITELPKIIMALTNSDIAVGNRWMPGAKTERHSLLRRFSGWVYRTYMSLFGLGAIDTMCGFKGYQAAVARDLFENLLEERWLFDTEIAYKAVQKNYRIKNFPITWTSKDGSKLDTKTLLKTALQIWPLIQKLKRHA